MNDKNEDLPINRMATGKCPAKSWDQWSDIGICRYCIPPDPSKTFGRSGVTFKTYYLRKITFIIQGISKKEFREKLTRILYFCNALESSLCEAFPRKRPGNISTGAPLNVGWVLLSQSDDSAELLHAESECVAEIRKDLCERIHTTKITNNFNIEWNNI